MQAKQATELVLKLAGHRKMQMMDLNDCNRPDEFPTFRLIPEKPIYWAAETEREDIDRISDICHLQEGNLLWNIYAGYGTQGFHYWKMNGLTKGHFNEITLNIMFFGNEPFEDLYWPEELRVTEAFERIYVGAVIISALSDYYRGNIWQKIHDTKREII